MRRGILLAIVLWCGLCAWAQEPSARPLTVEVFSARRVAALTVIPVGKNESIRVCGSCRTIAVRAPFALKVMGAGIALGAGPRARDIELDGAFRLKPDGDAKEIGAAGVWKLSVSHGGMRVLLTLDSERYVALALNGEAGANEPLESLKAMAVVVRTYALQNADRHRREGFDLCDSTHCQALKFGRPPATTERAVLETAGETLWFGARRASVFYAQNCGGQSEDAAQMWGQPREPYLRAHTDPWCTRHGQAQWHAELSADQMRTVFRSEGWKLPQPVDAVRVLKRTDAGRAMQIEFAGGGVRVPVAAGSFRLAVGRALGWNLLRSDWYTLSLSNGVLHFDGRGYGHGVGLCQAGAAEMGVEGHSSAEILNFYFPGTRIGVTAQDHGWSSASGTGWMLWTVAASAELLREGNAAWAKAQALYRPRGLVQPEVRQMPATELFRQVTSEPGWMLAATQGSRVFLQPPSVLKRGDSEEQTLLHEFLHVLVESEASPQAPLWLREGMVEALASEQHEVGLGMDVVDLNAVLARPASQADSQRAHARAGMLAQALIARNGLDQVRQWLRSGIVPESVVMTGGQALAPVPAGSPSRQR
jgi:stage II sporulation protein D